MDASSPNLKGQNTSQEPASPVKNDGANAKKSELSARVVLPSAGGGPDTDEEPEEDRDGDALQGVGGDFLADFPDDTEELELIHARIGSLAELRLERFGGHLKHLCLRQNFISDLDPRTFGALTKLEELDLYDNKLKHVGDALDKLSELMTLDLSFNLLKHVPERLDKLASLKTIYFVQNKISSISGLNSLRNLRSLELGGNRIRKIENLDDLVNIEELWLGKNKITKLEGLRGLKKLKILSLQSNRITQLEGLEELENLEQLYLDHNGIKKIEGLDKNVNLTTLDIGYNFVRVIENVSHLKQLEELWLSGNQVPDLSGLDKQLRGIETLRTIYLEANPCQKSDMANYRRKVMLGLPQVTQIDATYVRA